MQQRVSGVLLAIVGMALPFACLAAYLVGYRYFSRQPNRVEVMPNQNIWVLLPEARDGMTAGRMVFYADGKTYFESYYELKVRTK